METWRQVEVAACEELPGLLGAGNGPTAAELQEIRAASFTVAAVDERERVTDHDGRVRRRARRLGGRGGALDPLRVDELGRARHGARAAAARRRRGAPTRRPGARRHTGTRAREHAQTLCVGRTHGVHAEPTTFGIKLAGFAFEAPATRNAWSARSPKPRRGDLGRRRDVRRDEPEFEARVLERLGLAREDVSTQVVARDRHAQLLGAIALAGAGMERFATEVRHLQRTEVREVRSYSGRDRRAQARCRTSATRSRASRSPGWRACFAATPRRRWRTSRCGTSATSLTPPWSG